MVLILTNNNRSKCAKFALRRFNSVLNLTLHFAIILNDTIVDNKQRASFKKLQKILIRYAWDVNKESIVLLSITFA